MSGGGNRSSIPPQIQEIVKKYNIGQGRKARKSRLLSQTKQRTKKSPKLPVGLNPSFVAPIKLKNDPKTGQFKDSGYLTVPSNFRKSILPQRFPNAKEGDYYQIKMTNLRTRISGVDTRQLKSRGRLQFTKNLHNYFNYKDGDQMKFDFQKHFSFSMIGKVSSIHTISHFINPKSSNMMRAYLPKSALELTGLIKPDDKTSIHWETRGFQGTSTVYSDSSIGIVPASLGLQPRFRDFVDQFTIHNSNLTSLQANQLTNQVRAEFYQRELKYIEDATGIPLTGRTQDDKDSMLEYIVNDLAQQNLFDDFSEVEFHVPIQLPNGETLQRSEGDPDGLGYRQGSTRPEIFEIKAFAKDTIANIEDLEKQLYKYKDLGYKVNLVITSDHIPESIQTIADRIYTYKDISGMVDASNKPLLRQMLDKVRQNWPK